MREDPSTVMDDEDLSPEILEKFFEGLSNESLADHASHLANEYNDLLRKKIVEEGRIDILAEEILGYKLQWFHLGIIKSQDSCPPNGTQLTLGFRGSGKSTIGTITRCIFEILKNPNIKILVVSNTQLQAEIFMREVKTHFEANDKLIGVFGDYVGKKWDTREIIVSKRTAIAKESTVSCIGVGGPTASRHYDLCLLDDIINEENARTELQRERLKIWYYKSLLPTLESNGRIFLCGTLWNPSDFYNHLIAHDTRLVLYSFPAILDEDTKNERSSWPDQFSLEVFKEKKKQMGIPIFQSQMQQKTDAMQGQIFSYEEMEFYDLLPPDLLVFQASDLAISQKDHADYFAHCTVGYDRTTKKHYVMDIFRTRADFNKQTDIIVRRYYQYNPLKCGVESNAYQAAQVQNIKASFPDVRVIPIYTSKDKVTRAMRLAARISSGEVLFKKDQMGLIEELLNFPNGDHDDRFDALELCVSLAERGSRKKRASEPGIF